MSSGHKSSGNPPGPAAGAPTARQAATGSQNFGFLAESTPALAELAALAEHYFAGDPVTSLIKLRQFGEALAQHIATPAGLYRGPRDTQVKLVQRLLSERVIPLRTTLLFHSLREAGNAAVHQHVGDHAEALQQLELARELAVWFHGTAQPAFDPGPFVPPAPPPAASPALHAALARLHAVLEAARAPLLDEAATRRIIDAQLRAAGWQVDSDTLRHALGARPDKHGNRAIAEWPTVSGPADYALFLGQTCVAIVEAKRMARDVPAHLQQAKRYSRDIGNVRLPAGSPFGEHRVPFLFATNGRPYHRQLETKSGVWFFDARQPTTPARALTGWYSPADLAARLARPGPDLVRQRLAADPLDHLDLRDYQRRAVRALEQALDDTARTGRRAFLLAMATGTGKTRTAIALAYRLIKSGRFHRILFLVDRTALGEQAAGAFKNVKLEQLQSFADIYDMKDLADAVPAPDTRLHLATIQGLLRRLSADPAQAPSVGQYDCIIVDEAHRGYTLDREMTELELELRSEADYQSRYRRALEHFDAVKIGLTATPALHTTEIFGDPVFSYDYRDAVIDGHLVDHEPPYRITTRLAKDGIQLRAGEPVHAYRPTRKEIDLVHLPDDIEFDIEDFNRKVITPGFNRAVAADLATRIDPRAPGKTLVFCVDRDHADLFVSALKQALAAVYGDIDDDAVARITGDIDRPSEMIRRFKNELLPSIAVTVDLLTTGIDVPSIVNLVFLRRVRSRILYHQMLGRATRLCDDIGKDSFRIYDYVDLYGAFEELSDMRPVVVRPHITLAQLAAELTALVSPPAPAPAPTDADADAAIDDPAAAMESVRAQILARLSGRIRRLRGDRLDVFIELAGAEPGPLMTRLRAATPARLAEWLAARPGLIDFIDRARAQSPRLYIAGHDDAIHSVERGYGPGREKPADYIHAFNEYLRTHINEVPALLAVTRRPRDLTRADLRALHETLDRAGFTERALRTAYQQRDNRDIAASIIGYIRREALGEPLIPYDQRVDRALQTLFDRHAFNDPQRRWLENIGKQCKKEIIVDRQAWTAASSASAAASSTSTRSSSTAWRTSWASSARPSGPIETPAPRDPRAMPSCQGGLHRGRPDHSCGSPRSDARRRRCPSNTVSSQISSPCNRYTIR